MKKLLMFFVICLLGLSACSSGEAEISQPPVSDSGLSVPTATPLSSAPPAFSSLPQPVSSPSETPDGSPALESVPAESTEPPETTGAPDSLDHLTLNDFPTQLATPEDLAAGDKLLYLVAQVPDFDTWLYSLGHQKSGLVLRIGDQWKFFDLPYTVDGSAFPQLFWGDFDGDQKLELSVLVHTNENTPDPNNIFSIASPPDIWELHIIEMDDNNTWTDHRFDAADYEAILEESVAFAYNSDTSVVSITAEGGWNINISSPQLSTGQSAGAFLSGSCGSNTVKYTIAGNSISADFGIELRYASATVFVTSTTVHATVVYTGSVFGLINITMS